LLEFGMESAGVLDRAYLSRLKGLWRAQWQSKGSPRSPLVALYSGLAIIE
jgi:hypothetical protein